MGAGGHAGIVAKRGFDDNYILRFSWFSCSLPIQGKGRTGAGRCAASRRPDSHFRIVIVDTGMAKIFRATFADVVGTSTRPGLRPFPPPAAVAAQSGGGIAPGFRGCLRRVFVPEINDCPVLGQSRLSTRHPFAGVRFVGYCPFAELSPCRIRCIFPPVAPVSGKDSSPGIGSPPQAVRLLAR